MPSRGGAYIFCRGLYVHLTLMSKREIQFEVVELVHNNRINTVLIFTVLYYTDRTARLCVPPFLVYTILNNKLSCFRFDSIQTNYTPYAHW